MQHNNFWRDKVLFLKAVPGLTVKVIKYEKCSKISFIRAFIDEKPVSNKTRMKSAATRHPNGLLFSAQASPATEEKVYGEGASYGRRPEQSPGLRVGKGKEAYRCVQPGQIPSKQPLSVWLSDDYPSDFD